MVPNAIFENKHPYLLKNSELLNSLNTIVLRIRSLENRKLIIKEQSWFRNKRGTSDNLLTHKIQECLNRGEKVCGIFFNISKSFDNVWHAGLIYKLIYLGVPVYIFRFIKKFLSDRFF